MRECLRELLKKTLIKQYSLPNSDLKIERTCLSNIDDDAFLCASEDDLVCVIYNSIIDYSFNEFDLNNSDYSKLLIQALKIKIRYNEWQDEAVKIKYGFYGEVILYSMLQHFYHSTPLVSRGYFYNPLENSETKGYDSYHLIESDDKIDLWFGEVKFRGTLDSCIKSAVEGLDKALSDMYLSNNILAMINHRNNFNIKDSKIEKIIDSWSINPEINLLDEIKKYNLKLVYPILIIYSDKDPEYDHRITNAIKHINDNYASKKFNLSIDYQIFFILLPLNEVKKIKQDVIKWIESKQPLIS